MSNIKFKLESSLSKIFKKEIEELGYDATSLTKDEDILHAYCSYSYRLLENRPRTIHKADTFVCPDEVKKGLEWLELKIKQGVSVNPHLSSATKKDKLDGLLYDWGIHHLHLGEKFALPGFVERSGPVLFAIFRPDDVFFIDIRDHEGWSDKSLLEIVNRNWPELIEPYRIKGIKPEVSLTANEIISTRKAGINTIIELSDGKSLFLIGGGLTTAKTSLAAVESYVKLKRALHNVEEEIRSYRNKLATHVTPKGHPFRDKTSFVFVCKRMDDEIRFYDVVNNNYWLNCWKVKTLKERFGI